ncbi:twin-arginine translocase subunit TatC [bacterium]|nr:twin-arginine translocase subunit TatC [bacterium]
MPRKKKHNSKEMPFLDHLEELRWRILKCLGSVLLFTLIIFPFSEKLLNFLTAPNDCLKNPAEIIFLKPTGALIVRLEASLVAGLIASSVVIFYQMWQFIAPGLLPNEKKYFFPGLISTLLCFSAGIAFSYWGLIPIVLPILYGMGTDTITAKINLNDYIGFVLRLMIVSGIIFELPIISFLLTRIGLLTPAFLKKYRRYGIVIIFIFAAIITPPDPASQIAMALPLIVLYEVSIFVSKIAMKKRKAAEAEAEKENK